MLVTCGSRIYDKETKTYVETIRIKSLLSGSKSYSTSEFLDIFKNSSIAEMIDIYDNSMPIIKSFLEKNVTNNEFQQYIKLKQL